MEIVILRRTEWEYPVSHLAVRHARQAKQKRIIARLSRLREGVMELKIDFGPGYRVYLSRQSPVMVLPLCGGDKADQSRDIQQSIDYLNDWKQRGKP